MINYFPINENGELEVMKLSPDETQLISDAFEHSMLHIIWEIYALETVVFTLQSMGHTNHTFPVYTTWNVHMYQKSTVYGIHVPAIRPISLLDITKATNSLFLALVWNGDRRRV